MGSQTEWKVQGVLIASVVLVASMVAAAASGGKTAKKAPARAPTTADAGTAALHVTVFETKLPAGRIADMDARALQAKAETTAGLQAALAKLGETRILYHAYQLAGLAGETRIQLGSRRPLLVSSRMIGTGPRTTGRPRPSSSSRPPSGSRLPSDVRTTPGPRSSGASRPLGMSRINTVQYEQIGMVFELFVESKGGKPKGVLQTRMTLELSALADSSVEISKDVKAVEVRRVQMEQIGEMRIARPVVTIHVDGSSRVKGASPTAYVCRVLLSEAP